MPLPIQKRRDWPIIVVGSTLLSLHSGAALSRYNISVGSLSVTKLGVLIDGHKWVDFAMLLGVILSFFVGCGVFIGKAKFKAIQPYGQMLVLEGTILTTISIIFAAVEYFLYPMAFAMGIQNSMCTTWGGAVVRTTHFTGVLTDIGIVSGLWARYKFKGERRAADCYLFSLSLPNIIGHMVGALLGTFAMNYIHDFTFLFPGISLILLGISYRVMYKRAAYFQHYRRKKREKDIIAEERATSAELAAMASNTRLRESRSEIALVDI